MGLWGYSLVKDKIVTNSDGVVVINGESVDSYDFSTFEQMYIECPYLRSILDYKMQCFGSFKLKQFEIVKDGEDKELFNTPILNYLNQANPFDSINRVLMMGMFYEFAYGVSYIKGVRGLRQGFENTKALYCLPSDLVEVRYRENNPNVYNKFLISEIIDHYQFTGDNTVEIIDSDYMFHSDVSSLRYDSNLKCDSIFTSIKGSVENLMYIQQARGVLTRNRGALGMLSPSPNNKDVLGVVKIGNEDKKAIYEKYKKLYGLKAGQSTIIIPDVPMNWQAMTANIKDLMLDEGSLHEFYVLCDALSVPRSIFDDKTQFNNQSSIQTKFYNDTIIPYASEKAKTLTKKFNLKDSYLKFDYSHISCLQEDLKTKEDVESTKTTRLTELYKIKAINLGELKKELGYVTETKDFKTYYNETAI